MRDGVRLAGLAVVVVLAGCAEGFDWIERQVYPPPPRIKIQDKPILVIAFSTYEVQRHSRDLDRELTRAVVTQLEALMPDAKFIPADDVAEWKQKTPSWARLTGPAIGREFAAGTVVELNVTSFRTRPRGDSVIVQASLSVEPIVSDADKSVKYWQPGIIRLREPKDTTHTIYDISDQAVTAKVLARFAEVFAGSFYDRFEIAEE